MRWGFRWRALKWLFCSGRVAFYYRNAGSLRTERWLFSSGLRTRPPPVAGILCRGSRSSRLHRFPMTCDEPHAIR